jgi:hypothetical protein
MIPIYCQEKTEYASKPGAGSRENAEDRIIAGLLDEDKDQYRRDEPIEKAEKGNKAHLLFALKEPGRRKNTSDDAEEKQNVQNFVCGKTIR